MHTFTPWQHTHAYGSRREKTCDQEKHAPACAYKILSGPLLFALWKAE